MALLQELGIAAVSFIASRLSEAAFSAHTITIQTLLWLTSPIAGCAAAVSVRMGHHLGAGNVGAARLLLRLAYSTMLSLGLLVAVALMLLRNVLGRAFTDDVHVISLVSQVVPFVAVCYLGIAALFCGSGVLTGQGRPLPMAGAFLVGAFLLSPSLAYLFGFVVPLRCYPFRCDGSPLVGVWWGFASGYTVTVALTVVAVWRSDWPALVDEARRRSEVAASCEPSCEPARPVLPPMPPRNDAAVRPDDGLPGVTAAVVPGAAASSCSMREPLINSQQCGHPLITERSQ